MPELQVGQLETRVFLWASKPGKINQSNCVVASPCRSEGACKLGPTCGDVPQPYASSHGSWLIKNFKIPWWLDEGLYVSATCMICLTGQSITLASIII